MRTALSVSILVTTALTTATTRCQDMLGVTQSGVIYSVDSMAGTSNVAAPGMFGHTCLTRDASGACWTISRELLGIPTYYLTRLDPDSLTTQIVATCNDVRGMADAGNGELYVIEHLPTTYILARIDTVTGTRTQIAFTGHDLHGLVMHQGQLFTYSETDGLGTLDPMTGAFTDVGPGGYNPSIEWLATRADGVLIGGAADFYELDTQSGNALLYALGDPQVPLRGVQDTGMILPFGNGCSGVTLTAAGTLKAGSLLTTHSTGYPSTGAVVGMAGALIIGASNTSYQNVALPLDVDPLLGTSGCSLYVSIDASDLNFTTGTATPSLFFPVSLPPAIAHQTFYIQHAAFDFTGAWFWSNALQLRVGS